MFAENCDVTEMLCMEYVCVRARAFELGRERERKTDNQTLVK